MLTGAVIAGPSLWVRTVGGRESLHLGHFGFSEAISMEKRYFTSDLSILS
jgi:hypothetical protein